MFKHILVPTDGSKLSTNAIRHAVKFAKDCGARITFYFAKPDYSVALYAEGVAFAPANVEEFSKIADERADAILAECEKLAQDAGVTCARASTFDDAPYKGIIDTAAAKGCDLIFMASHGRRGIGGLLLGSETHRVLTHTTIPVLVHR